MHKVTADYLIKRKLTYTERYILFQNNFLDTPLRMFCVKYYRIFFASTPSCKLVQV